MLLNLPCGSLECLFNQSNLLVIQLCTPDELDCDFKALNVGLLHEANNNLKAAQKELLCWHWKFGHLKLARTQAILKSGARGSNPMLKAAANLNLKDFATSLQFMPVWQKQAAMEQAFQSSLYCRSSEKSCHEGGEGPL